MNQNLKNSSDVNHPAGEQLLAGTGPEKAKFIATMDALDKKEGLVDIKFFAHSDGLRRSEDIYAELNHILDPANHETESREL